MSKGEGFSIAAGCLIVLFIFCLVVGSLVGWGMNIHKFASCDFEDPCKAEIIRGIGIPVAPLGAVIGWIHIKDGKEIVIEVERNELIKGD